MITRRALLLSVAAVPLAAVAPLRPPPLYGIDFAIGESRTVLLPQRFSRTYVDSFTGSTGVDWTVIEAQPWTVRTHA